MAELNGKAKWAIVLGVVGLLVGLTVYGIVTEAPWWRYLLRLYADKRFLKSTVRSWGWMGPIVFMAIQALQVIISPIPGEVTGLAGGFLFGVGLGFFYSTIGLTAGTLACFGVGRWLGSAFIRQFVSDQYWEKMGFIVEAEGAIICFILYLIPGFPKDIISYLFGLSPMPFWVFVVVSTLGRAPGTWILSAQGAEVAAGNYTELALLMAVVVALVIPLWYYRNRILGFFRGEAS